MSRAFKRSDGLMIFTNYDPTNPRIQKNLVIDPAGREIVIDIPLKGSMPAEDVNKTSAGLAVDDEFPLHKLFQLENKQV